MISWLLYYAQNIILMQTNAWATNQSLSNHLHIIVDCAHEGLLYHVGEQFQPNCTTRCFCKPGGVFECERQSCPIDGPTCEIDGDPHYKTLF